MGSRNCARCFKSWYLYQFAEFHLFIYLHIQNVQRFLQDACICTVVAPCCRLRSTPRVRGYAWPGRELARPGACIWDQHPRPRMHNEVVELDVVRRAVRDDRSSPSQFMRSRCWRSNEKARPDRAAASRDGSAQELNSD
jgi:hypothetical protein